MGIDSETVWNELTEKLDALWEKVNAEFKQTEEYKVQQEHNAIVKEYNPVKVKIDGKLTKKQKETAIDRTFDIVNRLIDNDFA